MTRVIEDDINESVVEIYQLLYSTNIYKMIICSGRTEEAREDTNKWFDKYNIKYHELYFRSNNNNEKDYIIKENMWKDIMKRYYIQNMYDDRNQVVNHARKLGFDVYQVQDGDF